MGKACILNVLFQKFPFLNLQPTKSLQAAYENNQNRKEYTWKLGNSVDGNGRACVGVAALTTLPKEGLQASQSRRNSTSTGHERQRACVALSGSDRLVLLPAEQLICQRQSRLALTWSHKGTLLSGGSTLEHLMDCRQNMFSKFISILKTHR